MSISLNVLGRVTKRTKTNVTHVAVACILTLAGPLSPVTAQAGSLTAALQETYRNNPTLNAQRAATRVTDEGVPQALSGYRPTITGSADAGISHTSSPALSGGSNTTTPYGVGITISQPIFRGFRTVNNTQAAEANVLAARANLANTEQNVLLSAVQAYVDVVRDRAILGLRQRNIAFLQEEVRAATNRFDVGEGTRTDIAQAEARLAAARSQVSLAQANINTANAVYRQVVGSNPSGSLRTPRVLGSTPKTLATALDKAMGDHPAINAGIHALDAAQFSAKAVEGELLPSITLEGSASRRWEQSAINSAQTSASIVGRLNVPIYQSGAVSSRVRGAKELVGQRRIELDSFRAQVRAAVVSAYGGLEAALASIEAARAQVEASGIALLGVTEERRVGQRTTLDVLNAQQEVINARISLVSAERDAVLASYSLQSAIGRLQATHLGLQVAIYDPTEHYNAVRDAWHGLRTPDGR